MSYWLPDVFPFYCRDLKQMLDENVEDMSNERLGEICSAGLRNHPSELCTDKLDLSYKLHYIKAYHKGYPIQTNNHKREYSCFIKPYRLCF